jgi:hypothetical protein
MSGVIFISYRRSDAEGEAGRLYDDLTRCFGSASVFMDVSDIHPGKDFRTVLTENVSRCTVLLAIIGPNWTRVTDASGVRRLDQPNDFVRVEVAAALARDIDVIPVLVHGARMPTAAELPEDLQNLAYRNCVELRHSGWNSEVELFSRTLRGYVHPKSLFAKRSTRKATGGEDTASKPVVPTAAADPAPSRSAKPWFLETAGVALGIAGLAVGVWTFVPFHQHSKPRNEEAVHASVQPPDQGQSAAGVPAQAKLLPAEQATSHSGTGSPQPAANAAIPPATSSANAPTDDGQNGRAFLGWWYIADPPRVIPEGTPAAFYIGRHGNQFTVEMHASAGDGRTTGGCGSQDVPLTNNGLSMVWDEPANPGCHFIRNGYTANVRLYMAGNRLHMTLTGKYPSADLEFKHQG